MIESFLVPSAITNNQKSTGGVVLLLHPHPPDASINNFCASPYPVKFWFSYVLFLTQRFIYLPSTAG